MAGVGYVTTYRQRTQILIQQKVPKGWQSELKQIIESYKNESQRYQRISVGKVLKLPMVTNTYGRVSKP